MFDAPFQDLLTCSSQREPDMNTLDRASKIDLLGEVPQSIPIPSGHRRRWISDVLFWIRRTHLYFGIFLFPWAVMYGVTGFLFNHPLAFSDLKARSFSQSDWSETDLAQPLSAVEIARDVVEALKKRSPEAANYKLVDPDQAAFVQEIVSASVKSEGLQTTLFFDVLGRGGSIHFSPTKENSVIEKPPFAVGVSSASGSKNTKKKNSLSEADSQDVEKLILENPLPERYKQAIPILLTKLGYATGEVKVGFIPDLSFHLEADGKKWVARYNVLQGSVTGRPLDLDPPGERLTVRRFLTKLHKTHAYPYSIGAQWFWAVFVDLMSGVMLFWGVSGLLMWWQIKRTRSAGLLLMIASVVIAGILTVGMWLTLSFG